jgi:hypothetical protein
LIPKQIRFRSPYPRPLHLSDPFRHFSKSKLKDILQTPDNQLTFGDFRTIFHWSTPAGTYEETVYFLPLALDYMWHKPDEAREFFSGLMCFVSENVERLRQDGLLSHIQRVFHSCFENWTGRFIVQHFDKAACEEKGWKLQYSDYVLNSEAVQELLEDLRRYPACEPLGSELLNSLVSAGGGPKSAWLLEFASKTPLVPFERELLLKHYLSIQPTLVASERSPTYWPGILKALQLSE